jgi:hypothetical protein
LSQYQTYAELGAATFIRLGVNSNLVQAVPSPLVRQDRTYTSAMCLREWWRAHGQAPSAINLVTVGPQSRRSGLLYRKALGNGVAIGIVNYPPEDYDAHHWWRSSQGFRTVTSEIIAYVYAKFLFGKP